MIPRYGQPPKANTRYRHRPGAYGIFFIGNKVLLTEQYYDETMGAMAGKHEFQLPGGGVESHEQIAPALIREAYEETGWRVSIERRIACYRRYVFMPDYGYHAEKICHIHIGRALYPISEPTELHHRAALLRPEQAIERLAVDADREILREVLRKLI